MTLVAAFAAGPGASSDGEPFVGVLADSLATARDLSKTEQVDKLLRLGERACAVGSGPAAPLRHAACATLARLGARIATASLWEITGVLFHELRLHRTAHHITGESRAAVVGFFSDGSPGVSEGRFDELTEAQLLFKPGFGEAVARALGEPKAEPLLAEALRMSIAEGCDFSAALSVLHDICAYPCPEFGTIGGAVSIGIRSADRPFQFFTFELDPSMEASSLPVYSTESGANIHYRPDIFPDLDRQNQARTLFTGGAPMASLVTASGTAIGFPLMFCGEEPEWLLVSNPVVPAVLVAGGIGLPLAHVPASPLHPEERASIGRYRAERKTPGGKKRRG